MRGVIATLLLLLFVGTSFCVNGADVSFNLGDSTPQKYKDFVKLLRGRLTSGSAVSNGIPVLQTASLVQPSKRYIVVDLFPYDPKHSISVGIDVSNVYIVAFSNKKVAYFLKDTPAFAKANLFNGVDKRDLPYSGSYPDLETSKTKRETIPLGVVALDNALINLWKDTQSQFRTSLIVIIQMVAEAARFDMITGKIANNFFTPYIPTQSVLSLENNWGALSKAIQAASNGIFSSPVTLQNDEYKQIQIKNVEEAKSKTGIALLLSVKGVGTTGHLTPSP